MIQKKIFTPPPPPSLRYHLLRTNYCGLIGGFGAATLIVATLRTSSSDPPFIILLVIFGFMYSM